MEVNRAEKLNENVDFILTEGGTDPNLVMKATSLHLWLLNEEVDHYHEAWAMGQRGAESEDCR